MDSNQSAKMQGTKRTSPPTPPGEGVTDLPHTQETVMGSAPEKKSALHQSASMSSGIRSKERRQLLSELLDEIRLYHNRLGRPDPFLADCKGEANERIAKLEQEVHARGVALDRVRMHLYRALRSPAMPDQRGDINSMLRTAPTAWHIRTMVEQAIEVLMSHARHSEREVSSMRCLGEIARLFQPKQKKLRGRWFREAMDHPACLEALNKLPPKRTRGGTGGNASLQVIFTWCEFAFKEFDDQYNPNFDPLIYADTETYVRKFMAFAKEYYEGESEGFQGSETLNGLKVRTNNGKADGKPRRSFSFFKGKIEKNIRGFLEHQQNSFAPLWVWKE